MGSDPTNQNFSRKYGSITRDRLLLDVTNKSSLDLYQYFYIKQGKQVYLDNQNARRQLHKFKTIFLIFNETIKNFKELVTDRRKGRAM
jgi:hypothetical protein